MATVHSQTAVVEHPGKQNHAPVKPITPPAAPEQREKQYQVVSLRNPVELAEMVPLWEQLAAAAVEVNPFYEHWMLLPALEQFDKSEQVHLIFVIETDPNAGGRTRAIGMLPLLCRRLFHGLPIRNARLWKHPHCFACTPLVADGAELEFWQTFFGWIRTEPTAVLELSGVNLQGALMCHLIDYMNSSGRHYFLDSIYTRAVMRLDGDVETYLRGAGSTPQKCERMKRKLSQSGLLETQRLETTEALEPWLDEFLKLEAAGWKGKAGTAIACSKDEQLFFQKICRAGAERKRLMLLALRHNGAVIAAQVDILAGDSTFGFKMTYDEAYSKNCPGMMLVVEMMRTLQRDPNMKWIDSCAASGNDSMKRMWKERRMIATIVCPVGRRGGRLATAFLPFARYLKEVIKDAQQIGQRSSAALQAFHLNARSWRKQ